MSGVKLLVDTNVIVNHLEGNEECERLLQGSLLYISSITYAELLAATLIPQEEIIRLDYLTRVHTVHTNNFICETGALLRRKHCLKLPDALIAATSIFLHLPVVTFDNDFDTVDDLQIIKLVV